MVWVCCVREKDDAQCTIRKIIADRVERVYGIIITIVRSAAAVTQTRVEKHERDREKCE